jgi:hypothetical protein
VQEGVEGARSGYTPGGSRRQAFQLCFFVGRRRLPVDDRLLYYRITSDNLALMPLAPRSPLPAPRPPPPSPAQLHPASRTPHIIPHPACRIPCLLSSYRAPRIAAAPPAGPGGAAMAGVSGGLLLNRNCAPSARRTPRHRKKSAGESNGQMQIGRYRLFATFIPSLSSWPRTALGRVPRHPFMAVEAGFV